MLENIQTELKSIGDEIQQVTFFHFHLWRNILSFH
jgi:hypothetical protein